MTDAALPTDWSTWTLYQVSLFMLILVRCLSLFVITPVLGSQQFPNVAKISVGLALAVIFYPLALAAHPALPTTLPGFVVLAIKEIGVGLLLGFVAVILFAGIQLAGQVFGLQMGFGVVNVFDPQSNMQIPLMGQFQFLLAFMLFIGVGGHHLFLEGLGRSFDLVPVGKAIYAKGLAGQFLHLLQASFIFAFRLGMPVIATLLVAQVALGVIARLMPQMNVFMVTVPVQIALGLVVLGLSLGYLGSVLKWGMLALKGGLEGVLRLLMGG